MHLRERLIGLGFRESGLERGFYTLCYPDSGDLVAVLHTHVDDCAATNTRSAASVMSKAKSGLYMLQKAGGDFVYTGKRIRRYENYSVVAQSSAVMAMHPSGVRRGQKSSLTVRCPLTS